MRSLRIGCLPVLEDQHLVGIVTEADLLHIVEELPDAALAPRGLRGPDRLNFTSQST